MTIRAIPLSGVTDGAGALTAEQGLGGIGKVVGIDLGRSGHAATIDVTITCEYGGGESKQLYQKDNDNSDAFHQIMLPVQDVAGVDVAATVEPNLDYPVVSGSLKLVVSGGDATEQVNVAVLVDF